MGTDLRGRCSTCLGYAAAPSPARRADEGSITDEQVAEIVDLTLHSKPEGHTHWSCRTMADRVGVSPATVQRI